MRILGIAVVLMLAGCDLSGSKADIALLRSEVMALKTDLETERQRGVDQAAKITALEQTPQSSKEWVYLDPAGGEGYGLANTGVAPVLLSFLGSEPIGDGTKIKIQVGNMTSATFSGIKITVKYNTRPPQDGDGFAKWQAQTRTAEVELTDRIRPGAWTSVVVSLPGLKPDQLGHLALKPELDVVSLQVTP